MADKKSAAAGNKLYTYPQTSGNDIEFKLQGSDNATGTQGSFAQVAQAIAQAQHFVFIADWSFQPLTRVQPRTGSARLTDTIGATLINAARSNPKLLIAVHTWDHTGAKVPFLGPVAAFDPNNDKGNTILNAIANALGAGKRRPANLLWRMGSRLHTFLSHHQKFVVLDADHSGKRVVKAFFGGLDLTKGRFDFPGSGIVPTASPAEPFGLTETAGKFSDNDWYNAEFLDDVTVPRQGWQDFYASIVGPSAWDVLREFVGRWISISDSVLGPKGDTGQGARDQVLDKFQS
ncbi:MAG TPA: hypothetical protein VGQ57_09910, partial [Polyangiaceae bacterium]|nr:hypothetical protein [Polyangiaceae bacterium]